MLHMLVFGFACNHNRSLDATNSDIPLRLWLSRIAQSYVTTYGRPRLQSSARYILKSTRMAEVSTVSVVGDVILDLAIMVSLDCKIHLFDQKQGCYIDRLPR